MVVSGVFETLPQNVLEMCNGTLVVVIIHVVLYLCSKRANRDVHFHCSKRPVVC